MENFLLGPVWCAGKLNAFTVSSMLPVSSGFPSFPFAPWTPHFSLLDYLPSSFSSLAFVFEIIALPSSRVWFPWALVTALWWHVLGSFCLWLPWMAWGRGSAPCWLISEVPEDIMYIRSPPFSITLNQGFIRMCLSQSIRMLIQKI